MTWPASDPARLDAQLDGLFELRDRVRSRTVPSPGPTASLDDRRQWQAALRLERTINRLIDITQERLIRARGLC